MRLILFLILLYIIPTISHEHSENCGCPLHKKANIPEYIPDPNDTIPPDTCPEGHPRYIPDPTSAKPDYWDDDDDGPWEPELIDNPEYTWQPGMIRNPDYIPPKPDTYLNKVVDNVQEAIPWVTLGILLISTLSIIPLPLEEFLRNQLSSSENNGILQSLKAGVLGLATPLCSCGSLPIASGLIDYGIPLSSVVTFLTASQSAGIDSALITYGLLGPKAAIGRLVGALLLSIVSGMVLQSGTKSLHPNSRKQVDISQMTPTSSIIVRFMTSLLDTTISIVPLITLGIAISTAATKILPITSIKENQIPTNDFLLRILIITSSLPLQLCEHTTAALASNIYKSGLASSGLSFAFLLTAPATNLPTLLLLAKKGSSSVSSLKVAVILSCTALVLSYVVDVLGIDLGVEQGVVGGDMAALPDEFVNVCPFIIGFLMICAMLRFMQSLFVNEKDSGCCSTSNHCEKKVQ